MWTRIEADAADDDTLTDALDVPGVGVVLRTRMYDSFEGVYTPRGVALTVVAGARLRDKRLVREDRSRPPLVNGASRDEIFKTALPDPVAATYYVNDEPDY